MHSHTPRISCDIIQAHILPLLPLEYILEGSLFLVCQEFYEQLFHNEQVWSELFARLCLGMMEHGTCNAFKTTMTHDFNSCDCTMTVKIPSSNSDEKKKKHHAKQDFKQNSSSKIRTITHDEKIGKLLNKLNVDWKYLRTFCLLKFHSFHQSQQDSKNGYPFSYMVMTYTPSTLNDQIYCRYTNSKQTPQYYGQCCESERGATLKFAAIDFEMDYFFVKGLQEDCNYSIGCLTFHFQGSAQAKTKSRTHSLTITAKNSLLLEHDSKQSHIENRSRHTSKEIVLTQCKDSEYSRHEQIATWMDWMGEEHDNDPEFDYSYWFWEFLDTLISDHQLLPLAIDDPDFEMNQQFEQ
ncbi:hypothetical protein C9374_003665 [Naegleria lovaniensis]|uniref:Uncharacterized protein n=1 Tax=Naegleria lovaniensis TaxID=51637 RepID=A0AA88H581_NAELO|nr:uncharacterized protein C9374_003665 [Naegleria lovaniensis]KAG2393901.1 hypothetical protein C9374_003665 [Naegleria lovaniensis]